MNYDIFNGDADGICALHQLRLAKPANNELISGVKRDIKLLTNVINIQDSAITVLDLSLDSNRESLVKLLSQNNSISYYDHHFAGDIPNDENLQTNIDTSAETCTSLIVHQEYNEYPAWAICGAFGDNLHAQAKKLAKENNFSNQEISILQEIGELLNYNGYGADLSDLHFSPVELYRSVSKFKSPFEFNEQSKELELLREGHQSDLKNAMSTEAKVDGSGNRVYFFPDQPWARRVAGVFANLRARENENVAHALITENSDGTLRISVRAPLADRRNADSLCLSFPTGGGRKAAAGINFLPAEMLNDFLAKLEQTYQG